VDDMTRSRIKVKVTWLVCLTAMVGSSGCFGLNRGAPPLNHYVLGGGGSHQVAIPTGDPAGISIGLRRPQVASYLDTPLIVVRRGLHQIGFSEFHRWGEQLGGGIGRTVAGHLSAHASFSAVDLAPWGPRERHDYLIQIHLLRFEGQTSDEGAPAEGQAHVLATWEILRQADGAVLTRGTTDYRGDGWRVGDYPGLVTLLDAGLGVLAADLAAGIGRLPLPNNP